MPDAPQGRSVPAPGPGDEPWPEPQRRRGAHPDLPPVLVYAVWALQISALAAVVTGIVQRTQKDWLRASAARRVQEDPSLAMPTEADIDSFVTSQLVGLVLVAAILALIGVSLLRGRTRVRWYIFGIFLFATVGFAILLPFAYLGLPTALSFILSDEAPLAMTIPVCIASVAFTAAFACTVTKPARRFFNARKQEEVAAATAAGRTQRPGLFSMLVKPPIRPETQEIIEKAGHTVDGRKPKRSKLAAAAAQAEAEAQAAAGEAAADEAAAPAKPSPAKSRAATEPARDAGTGSGARRKGTPRSR